jgi:hypothetical protein
MTIEKSVLMGKGFSAPGIKAERADFSQGDFRFAIKPRFLTCSADGTLVVDLLGGQEEVSIQVFQGYNPLRVTKIYSEGSTSITVDGWV